MTAATVDGSAGRDRRRGLLAAGVVWLSLGVLLITVTGGVSGFFPGDPTVPTIGFALVAESDGPAGPAIVISRTALARTKGIEIRSGSQAKSGRLLWGAKRTTAAGAADSGDPNSGFVVIGLPPPGFRSTKVLDGDLPATWHAEVDNGCYFASAVAPKSLDNSTVTLENGDRVTAASILDDTAGYSDCNDGTLASRAGVFVGILAAGIGGVLLILAYLAARRKLPVELSSELDDDSPAS